MKSEYAYESMRYGFFIHYIAPATFYKDGTKVTDVNEAADNFDVDGFVNDVVATGVEYIIFTAWHYKMVPLYPSEVTKKYRPEMYVKRDLLGEIIDGLKDNGVKVILYTHPRDGHDFEEHDQIRCGWGAGVLEGTRDTPNFDNFDYKKWSGFVLEQYGELFERYGTRIDGIWVDGMGPGKFVFGIHRSYPYEYPIVDYVALRQLAKKINPDIAIIHNGYGYQYTTDFIMPESFFDYERTHRDTGDWPACDKAMALCFTEGGWSCSGKYGEGGAYIDKDGLLRYMIFQMTSASAGGICLAAGPYCGGGWDKDVMEYMTDYGRQLHRLGEGVKNIIPSTSWQTVSGDTLNSKKYVFACSSRDKKYEYIHIMKTPADGIIRLGKSADGARIAYPASMTKNVKVKDFIQNEDGVSFRIEGTPDEVDTIIRFKRENNPNADVWEWINDSDKRIRYQVPEMWTYDCLKTVSDGDDIYGGTELVRYLGCYEDDTRIAHKGGARFDTYFECSEIQLVCSMNTNGGSADVLVDDICVATISTKADEHRVREVVFTSGELYGGIHTFSVVTKGDGIFEFDAIKIRK